MLGEIRLGAYLAPSILISHGLRRPGSGTNAAGVHMHKYGDVHVLVIGSGPGCQICTLDWISVSAIVLTMGGTLKEQQRWHVRPPGGPNQHTISHVRAQNSAYTHHQRCQPNSFQFDKKKKEKSRIRTTTQNNFRERNSLASSIVTTRSQNRDYRCFMSRRS